jgi:hypothetical protein
LNVIFFLFFSFILCFSPFPSLHLSSSCPSSPIYVIHPVPLQDRQSSDPGRNLVSHLKINTRPPLHVLVTRT